MNGSRNLWVNTKNTEFDSSASRWARLKSKGIYNESQANLYSYAESGVRVIFDSLYPVEKGFLNFRKVPRMFVGQKSIDHALITATGVCEKQLYKLRKKDDYFHELLQQYTFLVKGQGRSPDGKHAYKCVSNFQQLKKVIRDEPDTIAVVVTIEGAHAFGCGTETSSGLSLAEHKELLSENIGTTKMWEFPPLFVNLSHHFWNQLAGQAKSFKPAISAAYNQSIGINKGITDLGWHVIEEMHSTHNGRRMLIDIKHMSLQSRIEYYRFIKRLNHINPDNKIPIVCSHGGVNGFKTMPASLRKLDNGKKIHTGHFNSWSINLSDEEVRFIHDSGGLIGIMMDKGLLGSTAMLNTILSHKDPEATRRAFSKLIWENIFRMVKAIGNVHAWDTITMGTDYDGLISHIDCYPTAAHIKDLHRDLIDYLEDKRFKEELWYDYKPKELVRKIMRTNAFEFLKRNFN